jgi:dTDP-glucose pyrophosphorylase
MSPFQLPPVNWKVAGVYVFSTQILEFFIVG